MEERSSQTVSLDDGFYLNINQENHWNSSKINASEYPLVSLA